MESAASLHKRREQQREVLYRYQNSFICAETGLLDAKLTISRNCPVCGSSDHSTHLFFKNGADHQYCHSCGLIYVRNALNPQELTNYYINMPHLQESFASAEEDFYSKQYTEGLDSILQIYSKQLDGNSTKVPKLLDFGCSSGRFLDTAKNYNFNVELFGVELNNSDRNIACSKGHVVTQNILDHDETSFDIITLWDVFEHIVDPLPFVSLIKKFLNSRGILFLQVPSCDSIAARTLRERCNMFDGLEHVNLYSLSALHKIAELSEMRIVYSQSVIPELFAWSNFVNFTPTPYAVDESHPSRLKQLSDIIGTDKLLHSGLGYKWRVALQLC